MHKNILYLLAVFVMPMLLPAEPILSLAGTDANGSPMRYGSGTWTESFCHPAIVSNTGTVHFIAQMPDPFLDGAENRDRFRAVYTKGKTDAGSEMLVEGYHLFAYELFKERWWQFNWQISGTGTQGVFFLLREDFTGEGGSSLNLRRFPDDISIPLPTNVIKPTLRLAVVADLLSVTAAELAKPLFYQVTGAGFSTVEIPEAAFAGYTQKSIALSPDSTMVYFTSLEDLGASDEYVDGKPGLYAYNRITQSHKLVAFIGKDSLGSLDSQVQCAADAGVLVFRSTLVSEAPVGTGAQMISAERDPSGSYVLQWCSPGGLAECADPQISADGRFVVFSATTPGSDFRQIFRFDRWSSQLEPVSEINENWANANCQSPAISPNGRYVALVSAATNFDREGITLPQVWLADMGPALLQTSLDIFQQQTLELPLQVSGASENACIALLPGAAIPAGTFTDRWGNSLNLNQEYLLSSSLPWTYQAGEHESGTITVALKLTDGDFTVTAELQIHIHDRNQAILSCVSLNAESKYVGDNLRNVSDASCSEDGSKIAFVTSLPLLTNNGPAVSHAYLRDLSAGTLNHISSDLNQTVKKITISGDGNHVFFIRTDRLWHYNVAAKQLTPLIPAGMDDIKPATDVSGSILAYSQNGKAVLQIPGQASISPAPDLTCKALRLSRDGKVLALLDNANSLHIWFADAAERLQLADNVTEFAMNQSGTEVFFLQDKKLYRQNTALGEAVEVQLPEGITAAALKKFQLSGNGRFLTWVRSLTLNEVTYPDQQFLFDVSTLQEQLISSNGPDQPGNDLSEAPFPAAFSASGRSLFFASLASNLLVGDNNNAQDLFLATLPDIPADIPSVSPEVLPALEDTPSDLPLTLISPEGNALVPLLIAGFSARGAQISLHGPVPGRNGYAVQYAPVKDFCSNDSFEVQLWDGTTLSAPQTVNVEVANVNDPPKAQTVMVNSLPEGESLSISLTDCVDDPDLQNPNPDTLSFQLPDNHPHWISLEQNQLRLAPDFLTVAHAENGRNFTFAVKVCDNHGSCVELPVTVSVTDVNQTPTLQLTRDTILQQENVITIPAEIFAAGDPDPEDQTGLLICLLAGDLSYILRHTDFPFEFTPPADVADQLQFAVYARDPLGKETAKGKTLTILLRKVTFKTGEFWGFSELEGKPAWNAFRHGWNLLSIPFATQPDAIRSIFGPTTVLWVWNTGNQRYEPQDSVQAGQGFWIHIDNFSEISPEALILNNARTAPPAIEPGWNLRGPDWQNPAPPELPCWWKLSLFRNLEKTTAFLPGEAYWFFQK